MFSVSLWSRKSVLFLKGFYKACVEQASASIASENSIFSISNYQIIRMHDFILLGCHEMLAK